jgi:hypothetical protein
MAAEHPQPNEDADKRTGLLKEDLNRLLAINALMWEEVEEAERTIQKRAEENPRLPFWPELHKMLHMVAGETVNSLQKARAAEAQGTKDLRILITEALAATAVLISTLRKVEEPGWTPDGEFPGVLDKWEAEKKIDPTHPLSPNMIVQKKAQELQKALALKQGGPEIG